MTLLRSSRLAAAAAAALLTAACGETYETLRAPDSGGGPDGPVTKPSGEFEPLITAAWSLSPGQEGYVCATKTLTETIHVGAIRPLSPPGTHHTVVGLGPALGPDDPGSPCGPTFGQFYASGIGTGELVLPKGVGLVAHAGEQLHLNLHVYNVGNEVVSSTSGVEIKRLDPSEVEHEASIHFFGPFSFEIPPAGEHSITHQETIGSPQTVIAMFPHMHRIGSHFATKLLRGGQTMTLWDADFQFESQEFALIPPVTLEPGDILETTCTWTNTTVEPVYYGDSSDSEMCFTVLMSY